MQTGRIGHVTVMQRQCRMVIQMIDTLGVDRRGAPLDAMHLVALVDQEAGQVGAILTGDTRDYCLFGH